ncbi:MAG: Rieske (2Fe-2S) protein [Alphaproteobacteria bacterium]|nr:Rieske (2Fe-2S) protein [Alphaproteobacteria bacterium]MCB9696245.1 Rieske (2Fe-2S) protein [Alphaproteobacteria bacterium]
MQKAQDPPFEIGPELLAGLHPLGRYERRFPVSVDRYYENLLDWEHLPHLHPTNFGGVQLLAKGDRWWTALVATAREDTPTRPTSVVVAEDRSAYAVRNPTETVFVRLTEVGPHEVLADVSFHSVREPRNAVVREALFDLYRKQFLTLSGEDLDAMLTREEALARLARRESEVAEGTCLGTVDEVAARVPFVTTWLGSRFWVVRSGDGFVAHAADCPHMLGPVTPMDEACGREVSCPWHAYRFDALTGDSTDARGLRLRPPFTLAVVEGRVHVSSPRRG